MHEETAVIPTSGLAEYITNLGRQHGVQYERTPNDAIADVITALADDEVKLDGVASLLLALERAGILRSEEIVPLHVNYLREKFAGSDAVAQP